jgi:hypothetical protein
MRRFGFTGWFLLIIFLYSAISLNMQRTRWRGGQVIAWDVKEYYLLVPAAFLYKDVAYGFHKSLPPEIRQHYDYSLFPTPTGKSISRRSIGMPIMYSPFFMAAHLSAKLSGAPADGFSSPYQFFILISGFVYAFIGLLYLRKILLRYFSDLATALTLLCITLGTNFYYYTVVEGGMSHAHLFGLFAAFLYYTIRWHESPKAKYMVALGIIGGLSILIRPTAIIIFLVFALFDIHNRQAFAVALKRYTTHIPQLLLLAAIVILVGLPQLIYWKAMTGQWLYYTYGEEGFFFNKPRIWEGLFSYRKGWLVYSPVMALSIIGFIWVWKYARAVSAGIIAFVVVHIYIIFCWWCWWYGGSFGMRAMIETHALLAVPMAAFWQWALKRNWSYILSLYIAIQAILLNLQHTKFYAMGVIHWDSMSKAFYWGMMKENGYPQGGEKLLDQPKYEEALKGNR